MFIKFNVYLFSGLIQPTINLEYYYYYFSQKAGFDISCNLSPFEPVCMKCQVLFSGKKYFNMSSVENFTQSGKRINGVDHY